MLKRTLDTTRLMENYGRSLLSQQIKESVFGEIIISNVYFLFMLSVKS